MNVKGSALVSTLEFVKIKYGQDAIQKVLDKLPEEDRKILSEPIMQPIWYPFKLYIDLTEKIDFIFGIGDLSIAREIGSFSASHDLKTIYRLFYKIGSPQFIIKKAAKVFATYFDTGDIVTRGTLKGNIVFEISNFPEMNNIFLQRLRGFMEKTLELSGGKEPKVYPVIQIVDGKKVAVFNCNWK